MVYQILLFVWIINKLIFFRGIEKAEKALFCDTEIGYEHKWKERAIFFSSSLKKAYCLRHIKENNILYNQSSSDYKEIRNILREEENKWKGYDYKLVCFKAALELYLANQEELEQLSCKIEQIKKQNQILIKQISTSMNIISIIIFLYKMKIKFYKYIKLWLKLT